MKTHQVPIPSDIPSFGSRLLFGLAFLSLISAFAPSAFAAEAIVVKAKGRQAIVEFPPDYVPKAGARIQVGPPSEGLSSSQIDAESGGRRSHLVALSANLSAVSVATTSGSSTVSSSVTNIGVSGLYGWNFETIEVGPLVSLSYRSSSGTSSTTISGGGFFDYDFLPNLPTTNLVAGLGAQLSAGTSSSSPGSSSSNFVLLGGAQLKWFCFGHRTALRLDGMADYERNSGSVTTTQTGFLMKAGLQYYF